MAGLMQQLRDLSAIIRVLKTMTPDERHALAQGGPRNRQGEGVVDRSHPYWQAVAIFARRNGGLADAKHRLHIAYGNVDVKTSSGVLFWDNGRVALQRRKQGQINTDITKPEKWAFPAGGFVPNDTKDLQEMRWFAEGGVGNVTIYSGALVTYQGKESHAMAAMRHAEQKSGMDVKVPPYGPFYAITKEPYGVNNEGYVDVDGIVREGDIHGTVMRYIADRATALTSIEQAVAAGFEVEWFTAQQVRDLKKAGETTLSEKEIEFLEWLATNPPHQPEKAIER